jgi:hypothetical protein
MYFYDGSAVYRVYTWQFYWLEVQRAWNSLGNLGSSSGTSEFAATIVFQHLALSAIGGAVVTGIGWVLRRKAPKPRPENDPKGLQEDDNKGLNNGLS